MAFNWLIHFLFSAPVLEATNAWFEALPRMSRADVRGTVVVQLRSPVALTSNPPVAGEATLEVVSPDNTRSHVRVTDSPFFIGRGEAGNHIPMHDRRISRQCAAIILEGSNHYVEDRGHHLGIFVNGKKVGKKSLEDGDVVSFGLEDSYKIVYRTSQPDASSIQNLLTRFASVSKTED